MKNHADMNPLEELRAIRADIKREFKTLNAYCEYLAGRCPAKPAARKAARRARAEAGEPPFPTPSPL